MTYLTLLDIFNSCDKEHQEKFLNEIGVGMPKKKKTWREKVDESKQLILSKYGRN